MKRAAVIVLVAAVVAAPFLFGVQRPTVKRGKLAVWIRCEATQWKWVPANQIAERIGQPRNP
jgi:hypothetical protein